jgi:transcription initiation factor TFIIB
MESTRHQTQASNTASAGTRQPVSQAETEAQSTSHEKEALDSGECPECESHLTTDSDEQYCEQCGYVNESPTIDHGPEWRAYNNEGKAKKSRVGSPLTEARHDRGLSTNISWQDKDANGNPLSSKQRAKMNRLRTWDKRYQTQNRRERNLRSGITEVKRMASALGLPRDAVETASVIFRQASKQDLLLGRSIEGVATAALYIAARMEKIPRTYDQVETVSRIEIEQVKRTQRYLVHELNLELGPASPRIYLPQFASKLDLPQEHIQEANRLIDNVDETTMSGYKPTGLAAAALFAAGLTTGQLVTQASLAEISGVTKVTIRNTYTIYITADDSNSLTSDNVDEMNSLDVASKYNPGDSYEYIIHGYSDN